MMTEKKLNNCPIPYLSKGSWYFFLPPQFSLDNTSKE
jgi:hypothetical protein